MRYNVSYSKCSGMRLVIFNLRRRIFASRLSIDFVEENSSYVLSEHTFKMVACSVGMFFKVKSTGSGVLSIRTLITPLP